MTVSFCKHRFPPREFVGASTQPDACRHCGMTVAEVQAEQQRQEDTARHATAHEGRCHSCARPRMLFAYQRAQHSWELEAPPTHWLCTWCWGEAQDAEQATGFTSFADAFDNASDEQLSHFLSGGPADSDTSHTTGGEL